MTEIVLEQSYHVATLDLDADRIFEESHSFVTRLAPGAARRPTPVGWAHRKGRQPVAEHDADRGDPEEKGVPVGEPLDGARGEGLGDALTESAGDRLEESPGDARGESSDDEQSVPFDEEAAWKSIVEGYGEEPPDPPGSRPFRSIEDLALPEPGPDTDSGTGGGNSASAGGDEGDDAPAPGAGSEPEASTGDLPSPATCPPSSSRSAARSPSRPVSAARGTTARPSRPRATSTRTTRATSFRPSRLRCPPRTRPPSSPGSAYSAAPRCFCWPSCSAGT